MTSLICGSLAFDSIMFFNGRFSDAILADQLHKINVAFLVPELRKEFGGCAGNIAYNLKLLNGDPLIMATLGQDGTPYLERLKQLNISSHMIQTVASSYTAQAFITTDMDNNQITAFHLGAMNYAHINTIAQAQSAKIAIIAPDGREGMLQHARDCSELNVPFIFDPGQGLPMFDGRELRNFIELATYVTVNDYEAELLTERTGWTFDEIAQHTMAFIVTRGELGAHIFTKQEKIDIPCVSAEKIVDPTGCGDAFRAGLLYGLTHDIDWVTTGRLASMMGAIKIAHQGGQNHTPSFVEIADRFYAEFGYRFE